MSFCGIVAVLPVFAAAGGPAAAASPSISATDILVIIMMMLGVMLSITAVSINAARCWLAGAPPSPPRKIVGFPKYLFNVMKDVGQISFCGIVAVLPVFAAPGGPAAAAFPSIIATDILVIIMMMIVMVMIIMVIIIMMMIMTMKMIMVIIIMMMIMTMKIIMVVISRVPALQTQSAALAPTKKIVWV